MTDNSPRKSRDSNEKDSMEEPPDLSLEEQAQRTPARDMDSKTEDFETYATVTGRTITSSR
jgi:hypothetical protein